jgi:N-acetylmuramate 1-kinase
MPTEAILSTARQFLGVDPTVPITLEPIKRGASGRTIVRVKSPVHEPFIGIHWTEEREDNEQFIPVGNFLRQAKLRVPEIIHERARYRVALVEDLGDVDLLSLKDRPFAERLPLYRSAFEQVDQLFYAKPPKDFHLMPPFDAALYRWEQEYFLRVSGGGFPGMDATALRAIRCSPRWPSELGTVARHLVHRDFQSQNLMIKDGKVWLIDFQGLRRGRQEYDLASLDLRSLHGSQRRGARGLAGSVGGHRRRAARAHFVPPVRRPAPDAGARCLWQYFEKPRR